MKRRLVLFAETEQSVIYPNGLGPTSAPAGNSWEVRCDQCFWYRTGSYRREGMICGRMSSDHGDPFYPETLAHSEHRVVAVEPDFGCIMFTPKGGRS